MIKKGIILEIKKKSVVVLTPDGEFIQLKKQKFMPKLGEEYENSLYYARSFIKPIPIAACFLLFINIGIIYRTYFQVYNTVYVSINPSIKLHVNRKNHILKAEAMNKDGETLLSNIHSIKGENCEKGIIDIIEYAISMKYLNPNNPKVVVRSEKENAINYNNINRILKQTDPSPSQNINKNSQKNFQKDNVIVENTRKNPTVQKDKIPGVNKPSVNIAPKTNNEPPKLKPSKPLKNNDKNIKPSKATKNKD
ncbi:Anti-sigma factor N-terminus [Hathewaya proteolytica DSM 3090]|uniref:Anti-sigma factor N-terminus n=1 Tax=Hathewaya proteolytica DSM 3090 TaxID=1121331 RepID=A0A1M6K7H3_9CLOT|nr:anti-sigma factor domain-containing protein [Hathewaya proteolytica]SHJ54760.1 Anti-sigma factor N-terminus [Hathewaya proteolytica DSM 3090]